MDNQWVILLSHLTSSQDTEHAYCRGTEELVLCLPHLPHQPVLFLSPQAS